jgi:hypothetical protein
MKSLGPVLLVVAAAHVLFGLYGLYSPQTLAPWAGLELTTPGAHGEIRAIFGGLIIAMGVAIGRGAVGGAGGRHWLWAIAAMYVGLVAGRVVSLGVDGFSMHTLIAGLFEGGLSAFLFWAGTEMPAARNQGTPRAEVKDAKPRADSP